MRNYTTAQVYRDLIKLMALINNEFKHMTKDNKITLGNPLFNECFNGVKIIKKIYKEENGENKKIYLKEFIDKLEDIEIYINVMTEIKMFSYKVEANISEYIGKLNIQAEKWIKSLK